MGFMRDIVTIWRAELGRLSKNGRIIAASLLWVFAVAILSRVLHRLVEGGEVAVGPLSDEQAQQFLSSSIGALLEATGFSRATIVSMFVHGAPLNFPFFFSAVMFFLPLLCALIGFDQIAGEIPTRSLRFIVVRTSRASLILGAFLARWTVVVGLAFITVVGILVSLKSGGFPVGIGFIARWGVAMFGTAVLASGTWSALTALCSTVAWTGPTALFLNLFALLALRTLRSIGTSALLNGEAALVEGAHASLFAYFRYLTPSQFEPYLMSPKAIEFITGLAGTVAFGVVFMLLANIAFARRDL